MSAASLLQPLPRRTTAAPRNVLPEVRQPIDASRLPLFRILLRTLQWWGFGLRLGVRLAWERRRGPLESRQVARHLRLAIEAMGGTAVKFGQQLSNRVDLLPFEFCAELSLLTDQVRSFPASQAIAEIERSLGRPLDSVFSAFDPEPIGAASIACVYQAVLRTGEKVAVKVQRPGIAAQFAADLGIVAMSTRILEKFAIVRPGFFRFFREELSAMFLEELDFTLEARFQSLYRTYIERDRQNFLTCPLLWREWCGPRVMVSEFVDGVPCTEVIAASETGDKDALAKLAALDIDPLRVGLNIARLGLWGYFELPFIHGDPHPANIMALPGSRLCMLDFGACSLRSRRTVALHRQLIQHVVADRVSEFTDAAVAELSPLPFFDVDAFRRDLEAKMLRFQCGMRDPTSAWFERTSVSLWVYLLEVTRAYALPVNPDTLRTVRATLLYDTLAFRLNPQLSLAVTRRYLERAPRRAVRRARQRRRRARPGGPPGIRLAQGGMDLGWQLRRAEYQPRYPGARGAAGAATPGRRRGAGGTLARRLGDHRAGGAMGVRARRRRVAGARPGNGVHRTAADAPAWRVVAGDRAARPVRHRYSSAVVTAYFACFDTFDRGQDRDSAMPEAKPVVVLFADVSGSTSLYETLGDVRARKAVARCIALMTEVTQRYGGAVVKTIGDEVMSTFPDAAAAAEAAFEMQDGITGQMVVDGRSISIRVGLHLGEVLQEDGDVFGDAVNLASRMANLAKAGQILTTEATIETLSGRLRDAARHIHMAEVKGKRDPVPVYDLVWRPEEATMISSRASLGKAQDDSNRLMIAAAGTRMELSRRQPALTLGRADESDIVIARPMVSRLHARIEFRRGRFVLTDLSSNGTFVLPAGGAATVVHRDTFELTGIGQIGLGEAVAAAGRYCVEYEPG